MTEKLIGKRGFGKGYNFINLQRQWLKAHGLGLASASVVLADHLDREWVGLAVVLNYLKNNRLSLNLPPEKLVVLEIYFAHWQPVNWGLIRSTLLKLKKNKPRHNWATFYRRVLGENTADVRISQFLNGKIKTFTFARTGLNALVTECQTYGINVTKEELMPKNPWPTTHEATDAYVLAYPRLCADMLANQGTARYKVGDTVTIGMLMDYDTPIPAGCTKFCHWKYGYNAVVCKAGAALPAGILFENEYVLTGESQALPMAA